MVEIKARYSGSEKCDLKHPEGATLRTDAPKDIGGDASAFSPTDLVASGLKTLNITGFEALTVEALRDLRRDKDQQINQRDKKIESQGREIEDLKTRLQRIEDML